MNRSVVIGYHGCKEKRSVIIGEYDVLLYYHFTAIEDTKRFRDAHHELAHSLGLKGRIYIAEEGINGTVSGTPNQTRVYMETLKKDPRFQSMRFKIDTADEHAFHKLHVRIRPELVNFSQPDIDPRKDTGEYIKPERFKQEMNREDTIVIDARNDYEYDLGHFRGAIRPDIRNFRELPEWIEKNASLLKGKRILTYCTGGIRCEKFTGWLHKKGYDDVAQLEGGIITYGQDEKTRGEAWDGALFVFDKRLSVPLNRVDPLIIGRDHFTGEPCERYINCANPECNKKILCTEENERRFMASCSETCRNHPKNGYFRPDQTQTV